MINLQETLLDIAKAIVDSPDEVKVEQAEDEKTITLTLTVAPDDMGMVIGRHGKIAKAIGDIISSGIQVSLANINKSRFGFYPDVDHNQILFGLKGMLNVGDELVSEIIEKRPYASVRDFINKVNPKKQSMIALIKGGAFDEMMDRKTC